MKKSPSIGLERGDSIELSIHSLASGGRGVGRHEGMAVFVSEAVPGDIVRAKITTAKKRFAEARLLEVLEPSPDRIDPFCLHFGECGGCLHQNLPYEKQLHWKRQWLVDQLTRIGKVEGAEGIVEAAVASPKTKRYRNKMEFAFSGSGENLQLRIHALNDPGRSLDIETCHLMSPRGVVIVRTMREVARETGIPAYNPNSGRGLWRYLVLRESERSGASLIHLISGPNKEYFEGLEDVVHLLSEEFPDVGVVMHSVRSMKSSFAVADRPVYAAGPAVPEDGPVRLREQLSGLDLEFSPDAFLQTNTEAAERLYETAWDMADVTSDDIVWDVYCGVGSLALAGAERVKQIVGFEIEIAAAQDARANAEANGIRNAKFIAGNAAKTLAACKEKPGAVFLDPPRKGLDERVVEAVMQAAPERIIYVSCNPATLARDLERFSEHYALGRAVPVDLFPHTAHVETCALLERLK
jgi:23S rRNA (uracil1939-C5)-methyltransferase